MFGDGKEDSMQEGKADSVALVEGSRDFQEPIPDGMIWNMRYRKEGSQQICSRNKRKRSMGKTRIFS